ncbi:hypothetical protein LCM4577_31355 [Mesorhizobium sp. LCM 4577]|nr:hypothetical protein LCM4577_31355 [Mesorhizobium sp. LCM 4577]
MDDASIAVERRERRRGPARQLQLTQIIIFDDPGAVGRAPFEQAKPPFKREGGPQGRMLARCNEDSFACG